LFGNPSAPASNALPAQYPVVAAVVLTVALLAIVAPLAVRAYRTAVAR
jgi:hypothetical protein